MNEKEELFKTLAYFRGKVEALEERVSEREFPNSEIVSSLTDIEKLIEQALSNTEAIIGSNGVKRHFIRADSWDMHSIREGVRVLRERIEAGNI